MDNYPPLGRELPNPLCTPLKNRYKYCLYPVYTMKLARPAGSTSARRALGARRAHDERSSCARRAGVMSWLSGHLNGVILQTFTKLLVERSSCARRAGSTSWLDEPRRASSSSQLHRVNGVLKSWKYYPRSIRGQWFDCMQYNLPGSTVVKTVVVE